MASIRLCTAVLVAAAAVLACLPAVAEAAGLNGHVVTAQWHAASTPYKNYFDPSLRMVPFYDQSWTNTQKNTASNIIVSEGIEFGWGKNEGHKITLDMQDDGRVTLTAHCDASNAECEFEDVHMTVSSSAFLGASLALTGTTLSGRIAMASLHIADGVLEVKLAQLKIKTNGQTKTETCTFEILQPAVCKEGACCDSATGKPREPGYICRPAAHPCDIVEMCDGFSTSCPADQMTTDKEHCAIHAAKLMGVPAPVDEADAIPQHGAIYGPGAAAVDEPAGGPGAAAVDEPAGGLGAAAVDEPAGGLGAAAVDEPAGGLRVNYTGLAALACVVLWLALRDRGAGKAKVDSPRGLPAHNRPRW